MLANTNNSNDWRTLIINRIQQRKLTEHQPFENIYSYVNALFERADIQKAENLLLHQQLVKAQKNVQEGSSELIKQLSLDVGERDKQIATLLAQCKDFKEKVRQIDEANKTLHDEYIALSLTNKSLESKFMTAKKESEMFRQQLLELKKEDAERLNDENEKAMMLRVAKQHQQQQHQQQQQQQQPQDTIKRESRVDAPAAMAIAAMAAQDWVLANADAEEDGGARRPCRVPKAQVLQLDAHDGDCDAVSWFRRRGFTDHYLATGGSDRKVKLWAISVSRVESDDDSTGSDKLVNTAKCECTLLGSNAGITSIDIENEVLLASSNDMASRIWSLQDYKLKRTLTGHSNKVYSAKFLGAANKIASGSHDRTLKIWDINRNACIRTYFAGSTCLDLIYSNNTVISGHFDKKVRFWDIRLPINEPIDEIVLPAKITSLDISGDGYMLLSSLRDDTLKVLNLKNKQVISTCSADGFRIGSDTSRAKFSDDGSLIACGAQDGSIFIWNTSTAKTEKVLKPEHGTTTATGCAWCPDRARLATTERSKRVTIWA